MGVYSRFSSNIEEAIAHLRSTNFLIRTIDDNLRSTDTRMYGEKSSQDIYIVSELNEVKESLDLQIEKLASLYLRLVKRELSGRR